MSPLLYVLIGLILGGFSTAWVLALVTIVRATQARKDAR